MRHSLFLLTTLLAIVFLFGCTDQGAPQSGMTGQVVSICVPSFPSGWTPPPLESVSTIVVLDQNGLPVMEARTDNKGRFNISIPQGTYFILVEESPVRNETGPYNVKVGETVSVVAHYQCTIR